MYIHTYIHTNIVTSKILPRFQIYDTIQLNPRYKIWQTRKLILRIIGIIIVITSTS